MLKVSCVSYLNSLPFMYGLEHYRFSQKIELFRDHPAECARKLIENEADIGLIPIAAIPLLDDAEIITNYCISADGNVKSVLMLSEVPLHEITTIILDYHSLTSVNLAKILGAEYWKIHPEYVNGEPGFESRIKGTVAAIVIGDKALQICDNFNYSYDLSGEWKKMTGLPFVFACWVGNSNVNESFKFEFSQALDYGVNHINDVLDELKKSDHYSESVETYLTRIISFKLDEDKRKSIKLFLNYLNEAMEMNFREQH